MRKRAAPSRPIGLSILCGLYACFAVLLVFVAGPAFIRASGADSATPFAIVAGIGVFLLLHISTLWLGQKWAWWLLVVALAGGLTLEVILIAGATTEPRFTSAGIFRLVITVLLLGLCFTGSMLDFFRLYRGSKFGYFFAAVVVAAILLVTGPVLVKKSKSQEPLPEHVTVVSKIQAFDPTSREKQIGFFQAGTRLKVIERDSTHAKVEFTSPDSKTITAVCNITDIDVVAGPAGEQPVSKLEKALNKLKGLIPHRNVYPPGILLPDRPLVTPAGNKKWDHKGFKLVANGHLSLKARLLHKWVDFKSYKDGQPRKESEFSRVTIYVGWGPASDQRVSDKMEFLTLDSENTFSWAAPESVLNLYPNQKINQHVMVLNVVAEEAVERQLIDELKKGDLVEIEGFFVSAWKGSQGCGGGVYEPGEDNTLYTVWIDSISLIPADQVTPATAQP